MLQIQKDNFPDHPFWRFVTKTHEQEITHNALLQLQQNSALQINLLLFCCWFALAGQGRLTKQDMQQLIVMSTTWHEKVLLSLDNLHERFKNAVPAELTQEIVANVKLAEHIEQLMLTDVTIKYTRLSRTPFQKLADACKNIATYCKTKQILIDPSVYEMIYHLLLAIFPVPDLSEARRLCQTILSEETGQITPQRKLELNFNSARRNPRSE